MSKINHIFIYFLIALIPAAAPTAYGGKREDAVMRVIENYLPGTTELGSLKVSKVSIAPKKKRISIKLSKAGAYIPFTAKSFASFKSDCRKALGTEFRKYSVTITAGNQNLEKLVLFADKKNTGPRETAPFVQRMYAQPAPEGLDKANIALWQSHGWHFDQAFNRWEWQRARIFQTVEDLYTQSYVMPYLMPMLENAGAYVMSPRERDINTVEIIIDNDRSIYTKGRFTTNGSFKKSSIQGFAYTMSELRDGDNPFREGTALRIATSGSDEATASACWSAAIPSRGSYAVYVSYTSEADACEAAHYRIHTAAGAKDFRINQTMGGGTWIYLGHFPFESGKETKIVELFNNGAAGKSVSADAVKIGGGMGNVARIVKEAKDEIAYEYATSGYPRFTEGARYFLQWAGAPDSIFTPNEYVDDYRDDYTCRGMWVNWLAGGSSMLPEQEGLKIPVDLAFAFHSDAGTTENDSIIGTLGIYCTKGTKTGNGSSRLASRDLTDLIMSQVIADVRAQFEPNWTRRGMWDKSYAEARIPEVPTMLLELLSHQNFADMAYGLDPSFRFAVSRAVYKGILKFLAHRDDRTYTVQPLPVRAFAIEQNAPGSYTLRWQATIDSLEKTATPSYFIVEERKADGAFSAIARVETPEYTVSISDTVIHSYRIIAGNNGGVSFPSEVLALCDLAGEPVIVVNGFTRISGPDRFDSGDIAGFYDVRDHGVPYIQDISYTGSQYEYRRNIPWMDDDAAGFGASHGNYETKVIAGNSFDNVYSHGTAIAAAGRAFISSSLEAFCQSNDTIIATVDIILGKQKEIKQGRGVYGTRYKSFPAGLQNRIRTLAANGTNFLVSGAFVATDLWDNPYSDEATKNADQAFAADVLGYKWRAGQAALTGKVRQVSTRYRGFGKDEYSFYTTLNADYYATESPDALYPADNKRGCTFMRYSENNLPAGTLFDGDGYRTAVLGFPFETIDNADNRALLMKQVLNFFDNTTQK